MNGGKWTKQKHIYTIISTAHVQRQIVIIKSLGITVANPHTGNMFWHSNGLVSPDQYTRGCTTRLINPHRENPILFVTCSHMLWTPLIATPFKPHTELWLWQTSDRDSPIRFCWLNINYNHTSGVINCLVALAPVFLWLCSHRLSLAVLVQTKFLAKFQTKNCFTNDQFLF